MMKLILSLTFLVLLISCENNDELIIVEPILEELESTSIDNITDSTTYPLDYILDSSWTVASDIQEGFFLSYTISYKSGKDTSVLADENIPLNGGIGHPLGYYINDTTYFIPHVAGSSLGYFQLYIYKNGSCKYEEKISELLSANEIDSIKSERSNPKAKEWHPVINNTFSLTDTSILFRRKVTTYPNLYSPDSSSSRSIRFEVMTTENKFIIEKDSLLSIGFFYSETTPLGYSSGNQPKGYIRGVKQSDNSWLLEFDLFLKTKSKLKENEKHIKFKEQFITY